MDTILMIMQVIFVLSFLFAFYWLKLEDPDRSEEFAKKHKILNAMVNVLLAIGFIFTTSFMISINSCGK